MINQLVTIERERRIEAKLDLLLEALRWESSREFVPGMIEKGKARIDSDDFQLKLIRKEPHE